MKLLEVAAIRLMIVSVGTKGKEFAQLIHETAVQTLLHAKEHGDATLADELVKSVKENLPGYVWQGLVKWYRTNSPIFWDAEGKVRLLKPEEKGYKAFDPETAEAKPAASDSAVKNRTDKPIEPFSIKLVKSRVFGMVKQLDKAQEQGGRGVVGDAAQIRSFLTQTIAFMDKVQVIEPKAAQPEAPKDEVVTEKAA